jgi:hypothetical protein
LIRSRYKRPFLILLVFLFLFSFLQLRVNAQQDNFKLEVERRWETYGVGGTCIPGTHNLVVADVDGDGVKEIITGGFSYNMINSTRSPSWAPFKIWRWNGMNLTLVESDSWPGGIWCVYAGDADGDGKTEIITAGAVINNATTSSLKFWSWNGHELASRGSYDGIPVSSMYIGDVDGDGKPEIVTVGRPQNNTSIDAKLDIWQWDGANLTLKKDVQWHTDDNARANSVFACDLNNDGKIEIVTAGYDHGLKNGSGQLRVWQWNGVDLTLKANAEWRLLKGAYGVDVAGNPMGNTVVNNVKVADVDGDGVPEIVTGGFTYDGDKFEGQLRIWNYSGGVLNLEKSQEWTDLDITELKCISINDVDGDGKTEIVTSGVTAAKGTFSENVTNKELAELRVWSWDGNALTLKQSKDWNVDQGVCAWNDATGDVDNDGTTEIITVGCSYKGALCDPDLRIWSLPMASSASFPFLLVLIVGAVLTITMIGMFLFIRKERGRP